MPVAGAGAGHPRIGSRRWRGVVERHDLGSAGHQGQPVTTLTSPIPSACTGALIWAASPTRIVTRRFSGNAARPRRSPRRCPSRPGGVQLGLVVVRQVLFHLIRQRARDRRRRLVLQRRDAHQVLYGHVPLGLGQSVRRQRAQHRPQVIQRGAGGVRVHGTADGEQRRARAPARGRGRRLQHLLEGAYPVGVALLLAQHPVQPGRERAAQAVRAEHQGRPHPVVPVRAGPPDEQLRLDGAGPVHDDHPAGVVGGGRRHGQRARRRRRSSRRACRPAPRPGRRPSGRPRRPRSPSRAAREPGRTRARPPRRSGRRFPRCPARPGHPRGRREQLLRQLLGRPPAGVGHLQRNPVETVAHQPLDLTAGERGRAQRLGEQPERPGQPGDGNLQRDARAQVVGVVSSVAPQRSSSAANSSAVCWPVPSDSARIMIAAMPSSPSGSASSGVSRQISHGHHLLPGPVTAQHGQPAGEGVALRHRESPGPGRPGPGWGWKSMVTAASVTARLLPAAVAPRPRWPQRLVYQHRTVVGAQPRRGNRPDLLGGDIKDPVDRGERKLRVAEQPGTGAARCSPLWQGR